MEILENQGTGGNADFTRLRNDSPLQGINASPGALEQQDVKCRATEFESPIVSRLENVATVKAFTPIALDIDALHSAVAQFRSSYMHSLDFQNSDDTSASPEIDSCRRNLFQDSIPDPNDFGNPILHCEWDVPVSSVGRSLITSQDSFKRSPDNSPIGAIDLTSQNDKYNQSDACYESRLIALQKVDVYEREEVGTQSLRRPVEMGNREYTMSSPLREYQDSELPHNEDYGEHRTVHFQNDAPHSYCKGSTMNRTQTINDKYLITTPAPVPTRRFSNLSSIVGLETAKEALYEALVLPRLFPATLFSGIRSVPSTILLQGEPGTGKTALVKAMAMELGMPLFSITPSSIISKWAGESERTLREVFYKAATVAVTPSPYFSHPKAMVGESFKERTNELDTQHNGGVKGYPRQDGQEESTKHVPRAIVFIDEIDAFAMKRGDDSIDVASRRLLNELLLLMTEYTSLSDGNSISSMPSAPPHGRTSIETNGISVQAKNSRIPRYKGDEGETGSVHTRERQRASLGFKQSSQSSTTISAEFDLDSIPWRDERHPANEMYLPYDSIEDRGYRSSHFKEKSILRGEKTHGCDKTSDYDAYGNLMTPNNTPFTSGGLASSISRYGGANGDVRASQGLEKSKRYPIVIIAATNRSEDLDPAIMRRFSRRIQCELPNFQSRCALVQNSLQGISHNLSDQDVAHIAERTEHWNGSDILELMSEAAMKPLREVLQVHLCSFFNDNNLSPDQSASNNYLCEENTQQKALHDDFLQTSTIGADDESRQDGAIASGISADVASDTGWYSRSEASTVLRPVTLLDVQECLLIVKPTSSHASIPGSNEAPRKRSFLFGRKRMRHSCLRRPTSLNRRK